MCGRERVRTAAADGLKRIVGVDLNPQYVTVARERFEKNIRGLELYVADIESTGELFAPVDLLYAGLVFEYVEVQRGLRFVGRHLEVGGICAAVLQRRDERLQWVSASPYGSLKPLESVSRWVEPEALRAEADPRGLRSSARAISWRVEASGLH